MRGRRRFGRLYSPSKPSAAIVIKQSYGSNASEVIKNVKKRLEEIKELLGDSCEII